jgi:steroid delta-isomerase-like uncharacterized protein
MASQWIRDYLDAWDRHDAAGVASFMTDDAVYTDTALGETHKGPADIQSFVADMETSFSTNHRFKLGQVVESENGYAMEWVLTGTNDCADPERGLPATGKPFEVPGISIGTLEGGKIKENRDYWSLATYLMQVGLMSPPGAAGS